MRYAILRTQKLKAAAAVWRSLKHSWEQPTPNADPSRAAPECARGASNAAEAMAKVRARWPEKRRKDAVLAIEYHHGQPGGHGRLGAEGEGCLLPTPLQWLRSATGPPMWSTRACTGDEKTPHLYAYVVPLDEATGRLNARKWLGGPQALRGHANRVRGQGGPAARPGARSRAARPSTSACAGITSW